MYTETQFGSSALLSLSQSIQSTAITAWTVVCKFIYHANPCMFRVRLYTEVTETFNNLIHPLSHTEEVFNRGNSCVPWKMNHTKWRSWGCGGSGWGVALIHLRHGKAKHWPLEKKGGGQEWFMGMVECITELKQHRRISFLCVNFWLCSCLWVWAWEFSFLQERAACMSAPPAICVFIPSCIESQSLHNFPSPSLSFPLSLSVSHTHKWHSLIQKEQKV